MRHVTSYKARDVCLAVPATCTFGRMTGTFYMLLIQAEAAAAVEDLSSTKQKLISHINELKEEVARETSLRASLESSHSTLMSRIHETEVMAEKDRKEVGFHV